MRELSLHILDITQNSIAAEAKTITITVHEDKIGDMITITVADDGKGMDEETAAKVTDPFYTSRTTRKVGLGIPMLKINAILCNGDFSLESTPGVGTSISASYQWSHIDRAPLGDMVSTMLTILLGNEDIDFIYRHRVDGQEFAFASAEMKELLDGLSFQTPDVYAWLKEYLTEGERGLG
ncbi:MAG: ATP-binding protein [Clostridiales bacterium]|nr:ATP-binding protein [Clostridiales bacterium]